MSVKVDKIEDAWIASINTELKTALGLKTVGTFEGSFDEESLQNSIIRAPYVLVQCVDDFSVEKSNQRTLKSQQIFSLVVGAESLRNRREQQKGCYTILDALREKYDGMILQISNEEFVELRWQRSVFVLSVPGLLVYQQIYHIQNN
ncbi:MAG: phage protein Gp37 [Bacteroidota bacterium]